MQVAVKCARRIFRFPVAVAAGCWLAGFRAARLPGRRYGTARRRVARRAACRGLAERLASAQCQWLPVPASLTQSLAKYKG